MLTQKQIEKLDEIADLLTNHIKNCRIKKLVCMIQYLALLCDKSDCEFCATLKDEAKALINK